MRTGVDAATVEAASPAFVARRIATKLGEAKLQAYRELMRTGDRWRFSDALGRQVEGTATARENALGGSRAGAVEGSESQSEVVK